MKRPKGKHLLSSTLAAGLIFSATLPIYPLAEKPEVTITQKNVENILSNLSDSQRNALQELNAGPSFTISPNIKTNSDGLVSVIVEFNHAPAQVAVKQEELKGKRMTISSAQTKVNQDHNEFKSFIHSLKMKKGISNYDSSKLTIDREFKYAFNGVSMTLPGVAVHDLLQSRVIKRIWDNANIQLELPGEKSTVKPRMADSIPQIGVDKLHDENIKGKGIKVGVLDTGIDYNHPDLTNAYKGYRSIKGESPKNIDPSSIKGWDFVDNDADPMETTYEDWKDSKKPEFASNGSSYYTEHGTHVSGTIAATKENNVDYAISGIAPEVDLYSYRVLGPYGSGSNDGVIAGIDKAVSDGMDVINLSLGSSVNDPLDPTSIAINNAMLSGVVSVVAAGNAGPNAKTLGSPGTSALGITVGASDSAMTIPTITATADKSTFENMRLIGKNFHDQLEKLTGQTFEVVSTGIGRPTDFEGKNLEGKIALIERGTLTFNEKIKNAKEAGAIAAIIYNNVDGEITAFVGESTEFIPAFGLTNVDGEKLKALGNTSLTFQTLNNIKTEGDHLADFSSRGPVKGNYDIKPDVVAPGVAIFSTVPEYINSPEEGIDYSSAYERMQGTSMATPHVAGVAALILQEHKDYDPFEVKEALMNTSVDLQGNYSVYEVGAGRINAYNAVHADTSIKVLDKTETIEGDQTTEIDEETGSLVFGRDYKKDNQQPIEISKKVKINNNGNTDKTFDLSVEYHKGIKGVQDANANGVQIKVEQSITVAKGKSIEIGPSITVPANAAEGTYEGYLHITNINNEKETYQVPFAMIVTGKGIDYLHTDRPSLSNDVPYWQYWNPYINVIFQLKNPMKTIDVILKDTKTGKPLGYIGSLNASNIEPDKENYILWAFNGLMYPFTNDPENPISSTYQKLPEGDYTLEIIASDESGATYSLGDSAMVDNTPPEVTWDKTPGIYELSDSMFTIEDGQKAVWVHGKVNDANVKVFQDKGLDYDQSSNIMFYHTTPDFPYYGTTFPISSEGDVKFGIEESDIANGALHLTLANSDIALAMKEQKFIFLKEGTEYVTSSYDTKELKLNDTFTMTLTVNNVKQYLSGNYDIQYDNIYQFKNAKLTKEAKKYAKEKGIDVSIQDPDVTKENIKSTVKVGAAFSGKAFKGLEGDMPLLDVTFKLVDDNYYSSAASLKISQASYLKSGQTSPTSLPYYGLNTFGIVSKHSIVNGSIKPEAFLKDGILQSGDKTKLGIKVYAQSRSGQKFNGTIDQYGQFTITNIPASDQEYTVVIDAPSHLKSFTTIIPGKEKDGSLSGQRIRIIPAQNLAGDINGDKVIDIKDIQLVVDAYGIKDKSIVKEDINQDGIVDEKDVRFIEKNFLSKGPDAPANKVPKEKIGNKGIEYFLRLIGLEAKS